MKRNSILLFAALIFISGFKVFAAESDNIEISKNFTLMTSKQMQGYFKPLFTTLEQGLNSNLFTHAKYEKKWSFAFNISGGFNFIPGSQDTYEAELPAGFADQSLALTATPDGTRNVNMKIVQPTVFGGASTTVFATPQRQTYPDSMNKSISFVEGNDIGTMLNMPAAQFIVGFPTQTQLRFRFFMVPIQEKNMSYYSIILNQRLDDFVNLFGADSTMGLSFHGAYHSMKRDPGIDISSWAVGFHFSKEFEFGLTAYSAVQLEGMSGEFVALRTGSAAELIDSPYEELRTTEVPILFDVESFNSSRFLVGASYKLGILEINTDFALASQPTWNMGITFWFGQW